MMSRVVAVLLAALSLAPSVFAEVDNQKRGFNVNDVYAFNGLDSINAFNGNLTIRIPMGSSYSVGGGLSYRLVLASNANPWKGEEVTNEGTICDRKNDPTCSGDRIYPTVMHPDPTANAGFGWSLSLGRLYPPGSPAFMGRLSWHYESPDGAVHRFSSDNESVATDGSYLRLTCLQRGADSKCTKQLLEFPSGEKHTFEPSVAADHWVLEEITNRFSSNYLRFDYNEYAPVGAPRYVDWEMTDSHGRKHFIRLQEYLYDGESRLLVKSVNLSVNGSSTPATITFNYSSVELGRGEYHNHPSISMRTAVQLLDSVVFPDGTQYSFAYLAGTDLGYNGVPVSTTLPTGGQIKWDWATYWKPEMGPNEEYLRMSYGVVSRKTFNTPTDTEPVSVTSYAPDNDCSPYDFNETACREFTNTIVDPAGTKTVHFFSVATHLQGLWSAADYGLPFTRNVSDGTAAPLTRWLSTRVYPTASSTQPLRSGFVRYEHHTPPLPSRVVSERTVYDDDGGRYVQNESTGWDGFGRYRTVETTGSLPGTPTRRITTNYLAPSTAWITGLYDSITVEESGKVLKSEFEFDRTTGFLLSKRLIRDINTGARSATDVVAEFSPDARGNIAEESYFGGDIHPRLVNGTRPAVSMPLGGLETFNLATSGAAYTITHSRVEPTDYADGTVRSSYDSSGVHFADSTIDRRSGLVSASRDTAGVETAYTYDWAGRITSERPTGRAWTKYTYPTGLSNEVLVASYAAGTLTGAELKKQRYVLDSFGRVVTEYVKMPNGSESRRETVRDVAGRVQHVSVLGNTTPLARTTHVYDPLGRVSSTTYPDGANETFAYVGSRIKTTTRSLWTGIDTAVSTTELYDGLGRLVSVAEKSGPTSSLNRTGSMVASRYGYDAADRLTSVSMSRDGGSSVQNRLFDYDGRGFLRWESQPEPGITSFMYDARGHVVSKTQGAANTQFDLEYQYDRAERLIEVDGRNPGAGSAGAPEFRPIKKFSFSTANAINDLQKGKLITAATYNYDDLNPWGDTFKVTDRWAYRDTAGRRTHRITEISTVWPDGAGEYEDLRKTIEMSVAYDDLDLPSAMAYPTCLDCGAPPVNPERNVRWTYGAGSLLDVKELNPANGVTTSFTGTIGYAANGAWSAFPHANGIAETRTIDTTPRPTSLTIGQYDRCVRPLFTTQPASVSIASGGTATLSVAVAGTAPMLYTWAWDNGSSWGEIESGPTLTVSPTTTTSYWVTARNACGYEESHEAKVMVGECAVPTTGQVTANPQPDGSWILRPEPSAKSDRTFSWRNLSTNQIVGTAETLTVSQVSTTTTYSFTVTDGCGTATSNVTIRVGMPVPAQGLVASWTGSQVSVTWPAVSGATEYSVQRRSGTEWVDVASTTATTYVDATTSAGRTYAYRVLVRGSGDPRYTNSDVATTTTFYPPLAGDTITPAPFDEMLRAVNSVRAAAGWPALTWTNVLAPSDPLPQPGHDITARQVLACRARMNEALQALGVPVSPYAQPDLTLLETRAQYLAEVQERTK